MSSSRLSRVLARLRELQNWESQRQRAGMRGVDSRACAKICAKLGFPQRRVRRVHVAGSKGKGTVAALVGAGLEAAGFRVCVLSSPHVESVTERVRLRGLAPIGEEVLAKSIEAALNRAVPGATWFDVFVAASLHAARHCDWAVIECGLGGRRDSTNVLDAEVCALTSVELEHVEVLGPTVSRIAREKAAIASRRGVLVASAACPPAALRAAKDVAANRGAGFALAEPDPRPTPFLRSNLGLAKRILDHLGRRGLRCKRPPLRRVSGRLLDRPRPLRVARAALPARREWLAPDLLVDAAHTPAAVRSLASYVGGNRAAVALLGLADDKDLDGVAVRSWGHFLDRATRRPSSNAFAREPSSASVSTTTATREREQPRCDESSSRTPLMSSGTRRHACSTAQSSPRPSSAPERSARLPSPSAPSVSAPSWRAL